MNEKLLAIIDKWVERLNFLTDEDEQALAQLRAMLKEWAGWIPTAENLNNLPGPLRKYVHDLETLCDPAGIVRENTIAKDTIAALEKERAMLQPPTDEEQKEMLDFLDEQEGCVMEPIKLSGYELGSYHRKRLEIIAKLRTAIKAKRTVTREQLETLAKRIKFQVDYTVRKKLDYPIDIAIENTKDMLAELGLEAKE